MTRSRALFGLQAIVTLALLFLLFRHFDWPAFLTILIRLPPGLSLWCFLLLAAAQFVYAFRWFVVLRTLGVRVSFVQVIQHYFISLFFGNFLPTVISGDVTKIFYLGQQEGYV